MPHKGQILIDQQSGDSFEFIETSKDTHGDRVTLQITLKSKGKTVDDHIHLIQSETFKVISGRLTYFLNKEKKYLSKGESITLPKNMAHNHYNTDDEPVVYIQTIEPAMDIDYFIENLIGMTNDGKVKNGQLPFLQAMVTGRYLESPSRLAGIPRGIQEVLINTLGPLSRIFGYRAIYKKYAGIEK